MKKNDATTEVVPVVLTRNNTPPLFVTLKECNNKFRFQVRLKAGGKLENRIDQIVRKNGLVLKLPNTPDQINTIGALGAIQHIVYLYGDKGLDDTLYVISKVFHLGHGIILCSALTDVVLLGVAHSLAQLNMNRYDVVNRLAINDNHEKNRVLNSIKNVDRSYMMLNMQNWVLSRIKMAA